MELRDLGCMVDDLESLCLIKECRELEKWFRVKYVDSVLGGGDFCLREAKEEIEDKDRKKLVRRRYLWWGKWHGSVVG